ncbi:MAG: monofunctional biosynthetic peptidoglycan transglycosylase [Proteobacteria bacterium]|nr:monofunctional biosynthetic peptidoglycan transglycosylase [Pseudomonadota bacterium]MBS0574043.1 monofunctional biosynthetic peptidoglycan transglycosylase [Pseudomonadota bacterium]
MTDTPARKTKKRTKAPAASARRPSLRRALHLAGRAALAAAGLFVVLLILGAFINPRLTPYILAERLRLGPIERNWVAIGDMAPEVARSVVAAEDANFCNHWGFDIKAIRSAIDHGSQRGASTLSQQVTKNVFLWQGHSWLRKALEAVMTPVVELVWTKRRILEIYLNVAETGPGIFGFDAAARHYFKVPAARLTADQAARIAAVLPDPKGRNPARPGGYLRSRAAQIRQGADTIEADGRAACFED